LYGRVPEQQLNLFDLPAGFAAELDAGAAQVMGRQFAKRRAR